MTGPEAEPTSAHPPEDHADHNDVEKSAVMNPSHDEESQNLSTKPDVAIISPTSVPVDELGLEDNSNVPQMSYLRLFWFFFYRFGLFA